MIAIWQQISTDQLSVLQGDKKTTVYPSQKNAVIENKNEKVLWFEINFIARKYRSKSERIMKMDF